MCVCVCVCERERERDYDCVRESVCVRLCVCHPNIDPIIGNWSSTYLQFVLLLLFFTPNFFQDVLSHASPGYKNPNIMWYYYRTRRQMVLVIYFVEELDPLFPLVLSRD